MKKVTLSSVFHSARRRGCTLVVNLKPGFSFIKTMPAGTEALKGETILHIPEQGLKERNSNTINNSTMYKTEAHSQKDELVKVMVLLLRINNNHTAATY